MRSMQDQHSKMLNTKRLRSEFTETYNGMPARVFKRPMLCAKYLAELYAAGVSHKVKIVKHKIHGLQFIVLWVNNGT